MLDKPSAIFTQNARSTSRRTGGRPGDRIAGRPVNVTIHPGCRPIKHLRAEVLRRPLESAQYTSLRFGESLMLSGMVPSIGSVGDAYDNALAETIIGLYKTECIPADSPFRAGPLNRLADLEAATAAWVDWFNNRRLMHRLGRRPPAEHEAEYNAKIRDGQPTNHT